MSQSRWQGGYRQTSTADTFELGPLPPGEYLVGTPLRGIGRPLVEHVRKGEIDGWCIVELRTRSLDGLAIVVTEALAGKLRAELQVKR